jgi:hypothetical protein
MVQYSTPGISGVLFIKREDGERNRRKHPDGEGLK